MENIKLQKIEGPSISEHSCLEVTDICLTFGEYASEMGYQHSPMNQLIFNLKKPVERKGNIDWRHKEEAIDQIAELLIATPNWHKLKKCTWIPLPPSKKKNHPEYDDRLIKILEKIGKLHEALDVREMVMPMNDRLAAHRNGKRFTVNDHLNNLVFDEKLIKPDPKAMVIFDDVITSGASFKAAQITLRKQFPSTPIAGIFVARAVNYP